MYDKNFKQINRFIDLAIIQYNVILTMDTHVHFFFTKTII